MFLAADPLRGREADSPEYVIAAQYVAAQFLALGLRPAGDAGTYLQKVPLVSFRPDTGAMRLMHRSGRGATLVFGEDYLPAGNPARTDYAVRAPVVFVGQGVVGLGHDDYRGVDVRGKIVALFRGAPASLPPEARAHFATGIAKARTAMEHGAVGYIVLESPPPKGRPGYSFARAARDWERPQLTWGEVDGTGNVATPSTPRLGTLSRVGAAKLFEGAGTSWEHIWKQAASADPHFAPLALPVTLDFAVRTGSTTAASYNVAGLLRGSDATLTHETIVVSAHLDHVGVGEADASGDAIYNGALDNAIGIGALIEAARRFRAAGKAPRRSILFLAVTAEEEGLLGSDYFVSNPTVPQRDIVANINLDMPILTYRFEDITPYGAEHSTLWDAVLRAVTGTELRISPDPRPEEAMFVRSDHYSFVQRGIPSVFIWPGEAGPGKAAAEAFFATHYHKPSDSISQTPAIDWLAGVRFVDINYRIAREIGDAPERPMWRRGDVFGLAFGGPMQRRGEQ